MMFRYHIFAQILPALSTFEGSVQNGACKLRCARWKSFAKNSSSLAFAKNNAPAIFVALAVASAHMTAAVVALSLSL